MRLNLAERRNRIAAVGTIALLAVSGLFVVEATSASAEAQNRYVAKTGSDSKNDCTAVADPCLTIGYAISQAKAGDTVQVGAGTYDESLHITKSLTLIGNGATGSSRTTIDGNGDGGSSIWIDGVGSEDPVNVTVSDVDVAGNQDTDGIVVQEATATIQHTNASHNSGSGIVVIGADTQVTITDTTADDNDQTGVVAEPTDSVNTADVTPKVVASQSITISDSDLSGNGAEGIANLGGTATVNTSFINSNGDGGAIAEAGSLTVNSSYLAHNSAAGAAAVASGVLTINKSTVADSVPAAFSESPVLGAGVAALVGGTVNVNTSTIYHNTGQGVLAAFGTANVHNSTVVGTKPSSSENNFGLTDGALSSSTFAIPADRPTSVLVPNAKKLVLNEASPPTALNVTGTLVADNLTSNCTKDVSDSGYNLSDDKNCGFSATGSINNGTAKLGPFGLNGGPTKTLVPIKGSDAIDQIPSGKAGCASGNTDQRGDARLQGAKCDIGSVEVHQTPIVISPASLPAGSIGVAYHVQLTATGGLGAPYEFSLVAGDHLPDGITLSSTGLLSGTPTEAGTFTFTVSVDDPTLKTYTLVIGGGTAPLANTGVRTASLVEFGGIALAIGLVLMIAGGYKPRRVRV